MADQPNWNEANITINGTALTQRQSMTVRVALETLSLAMIETGLKEDALGKAIVQAYLDNIQAIRAIMYATEGG